MSPCRLFAFVACTAFAAAVPGCVSDATPSPLVAPEAPDAAPEDPARDLDARAPCEEARVYLVALRQGTCAEVPGNGGTWSPRPAFPGAPPEVQRFACAYRWSSESAAPPDGPALRAVFGALASWDVALAPVCGTDATFSAVTAEATPIANISIPVGLAGSVGCDVCGFVWQDKLWAIISPERVEFRELEVQLASGGRRAFRLAPTSGRALVVDLPMSPTSPMPYVPGLVTVY